MLDWRRIGISFKIGDKFYMCEAQEKGLHNPDGSLVDIARDISDIDLEEFNRIYSKLMYNVPSEFPTPVDGSLLGQEQSNISIDPLRGW